MLLLRLTCFSVFQYVLPPLCKRMKMHCTLYALLHHVVISGFKGTYTRIFVYVLVYCAHRESYDQ